MRALADFDLAELQAEFTKWGHSPGHAQRLLREFYLTGGAVDFARLRLGKALHARLAREIAPRRARIAARAESADGTVKLLLRFGIPGTRFLIPNEAPHVKNPPLELGSCPRNSAETVLIPALSGPAAAGCVSSQIGCAMSCDFCASTRGGFARNLEAGEIVEQFLHLRALALQTQRRLRTLVFMGTGEPLLNLDNVLSAIRRIACAELGALGWRQITVSTVGVVPEMDRLTAADLNIHLALSLHAPDDATRTRLVPLNRRYPVAEVLAALRRFEKSSGRIPTVEYCLLSGVNDSGAQARELAERMAGFRAHVNLIPYNDTGPGLSGTVYAPSPPERRAAFLAILRQAGVVAHLRQPRGGDVCAACGQLRARVG